MWGIYDELIEQLPEDVKITNIFRTKRRVFVETTCGIGTAMCFSESMYSLDSYIGCRVQEVSELIKSWDFDKASVGLAAMNSYFNQLETINSQNFKIQGTHDVFADYQEPSNQKIATIGYFHYLDRYPKLKEALTIFELKAIEGTYPASATEFLLPEMDVVFITGSTLVNKTLPRLLELSREVETILVGGSVPLSATLFSHGVNQLAGKVVTEFPTDQNACRTQGKSFTLINK
ncbi:Rossmann-like domain-containing protein [Vagococcus elongatus]|uniref:Heavy-metal chelation domain-containing protein n=1 Tax=Vagococcus elongatus TaxID=180344 RepID=A0A430AMM5_9ENTE|nr:DUF364 domain-containing protein [Vagococcus elongatus]RSU09349.1 hypothetical protein CBF29_11635 [Vagococcus elongatus]